MDPYRAPRLDCPSGAESLECRHLQGIVGANKHEGALREPVPLLDQTHGAPAEGPENTEPEQDYQ